MSELEGCSTILELMCSLVMNSLIEMAIKSISSEMCASWRWSDILKAFEVDSRSWLPLSVIRQTLVGRGSRYESSEFTHFLVFLAGC